VAGRTDNALENLRNAAENGLKHGAIGYLITDWGDNGHWQPAPASYFGFAYGAALAWAYEANRNQDVSQITGIHALGDPTGRAGRLACDLGRAYLKSNLILPNRSILFWILQATPAEIANRQGLTRAGLIEALEYLDELSSGLPEISPGDRNKGLVRREFTWMAEMLRHACRRGLWALGKAENQEDDGLRHQLAEDSARLITEFQELWLARNRPGGLEDSLALLEKMRQDYAR
jgi:hypothetical protein